MANREVAMLLLREGRSPKRQWHLSGQVVTIGRGDDCDIIIDDRQASRHHARITYREGEYFLEDLESKNGTFLNGGPLNRAAPIKDGDVIGIALCAKLAFVDAGATAPVFIDGRKAPEPGIRLDTGSRRVWVTGREISPPLSPAQYRFLELLYENEGKIIGREEVVSAVWREEESEGVSEQAIDALARRLRERIAEIDPNSTYIVTVRGHGFRLDLAREADNA